MTTIREALRIFIGAAYPVSTDIDPRGHRWSEAYLDQALDAARAALAAQPAQKVCRGIPRVGCNYLAECETVCNKCGQVHDVQHSAAQPAVADMIAERERVNALLAAIREHWVKANGEESMSVSALDAIAEAIADGSYVAAQPAQPTTTAPADPFLAGISYPPAAPTRR